MYFVTDVEWDTASRKLCIVFPVDDYQSHSVVCGILYGFIERTFDPGTEHLSKYPPNTLLPPSGYDSVLPPKTER